MYKIISLTLMMVLATAANAAGEITAIWFAGPDDPNHVDVVQIQISGGYSMVGCDSSYAAIRNDANRAHMISFALAAYVSKDPVAVVLNPSDKYFSDRCTISRISTD